MRKKTILLVLTMMLCGRAMTLPFIGDAGGAVPGSPPAAWLTPLVGDAVIGLTGVAMLALLWRGRGLWAWTTLVVWNALAIWDALSAFGIQMSNPWPEFFMIRTFGPSIFFMATAMHLVNLYLLAGEDVRRPMFASAQG